MDLNSAETIFVGDSEMAMLMRSLDWSQTPLGPVSGWASSLKTAVSICLNSRFPMVIWWGNDLALLYNDAWRSVLGTKHPNALGQPGQQVWAEVWDIIGVQLRSVLETGQATWSDDMLIPGDRYGFVEESYFTYSYSPIFLESGAVGGAFTAVTETTQRVVGERRLSTLRELAADTVEAKSVEDACHIATATLANNLYDIPFALLYLIEPDCEQARLVETVRIEAGTPASPAVVDLRQTQDCWNLNSVYRTGQPNVIEALSSEFGHLSGGAWEEPSRSAAVLPVAQSGQKQPAGFLVLGISPRREFDSNYRGFFDLIASNVATAIANAQSYEAERKRAEALAELDRAKTIFFSNISHEFRTPLTLILNPLAELSNVLDGRLDPEAQELLQLAQRNGVRLQKLVNTLLDFSRIEAGRIQACYEPIDLAALTADLASVFRSLIERAGMRLVIDCPPLPEPVYVDREMWEKIVLNLMSNAFKFTFEGSITVRLVLVGDRVELSIADTGVGIPPEELPRLFERFYRVSGMRSRTYEGSGIGLALVQELVKLHGGELRVTSRVDCGTTFTVSLPLGMGHLSGESICAACSSTSTELGASPYVEEALRWLPTGMLPVTEPLNEGRATPWERPRIHRILVADDNADMRDYLQRLLSQQYEVEVAADGTAALSAIRRQVPDLVLTDVMMPGLDGFGLLQVLRSDPQTQELPIILLSARAGEDARIEGLEAGADDYLMKPFSARELFGRIDSALKLAQLRRQSTQQEYALRKEAETARQQAEAAYRHVNQILECMTDAFVAFDCDWRYTYVNPAALQLLQKPAPALIGKNVWEVFPDLVDGLAYQKLHQALDEQVPVLWEEFSEPLQRWLEVRAYPSSDGVAAYFQDITVRKQAEVEIQQLNQQLTQRIDELQTLFALLPIGVAIAEDPDCRVIRENPYLARLTRVPANQNASHSAPPEEHPGFRLCRDGAEIPVHNLPMQVAGRHNVEVRDEVLDLVHPDGTVINLLCYCAPLLDEHGQVRGVVGAFIDVTQRIKHETALRESEDRLKIALQTGKLGSWQLDLTTGALECSSQCRVDFGAAPDDDLSYQRLFERMHVDDRAKVHSMVEQAIANHDDYDAEYRVMWPDGSIHWIIARGRAIYSAEGDPIRMIGVTLDITERKQAEIAIREGEMRLKLAIEAGRMVAWEWHPWDGTLIASSNVAEIYGLPALQAGQQRLSLLHPDDQAFYQERVDQAIATQTSYHAEFRVIRPDTHAIVWLEERGQPILDADNRLQKLVGVTIDVTARKQAEEALQESERRFRRLVESNMFGVAFGDLNGGIHYVNDYFVDMVGYSREEIESGQIRWIDITPPEYLPLDENARLELMTRGVATPFEKEYIRHDGSRVPVLIGSAMLDETYDKHREVIAFYVNLSGRKQTENALRQALQKLNFHVENTPMAVIEWDSEFRAIRWSKAAERILGWQADEVIGKCLTDLNLVFEDDKEEVSEVIERLIAGKDSCVFSCNRNYTKHRDVVDCEWYNSSLRDESGRMISVLSLVLDITDKKRSEAEREQLLAREQAAREAAEAANRIKDEFLAVISHELRSPLNPILGWSKLLREHQLDEEKTERALEVIERNAQMQAQLINDLLDVSRILRGKLSLEIKPVEPIAAIQAALETVRLAAEAKQIQMNTRFERDVGHVAGDLGRLQQVIWNLLSNAVKFTAEGGRVDIDLRRIGSHAQITIRDTGKGIPATFLPYVFEQFRQESSATTRRFGGLGLGLTIVRYLVELHGGTVAADSAGEGKGATFTVKLPLIPHRSFTNAESQHIETALDLQGTRILVVDDDENTREFLAFLLELHGAHVMVVATADEAFNLLTQFQPDVLLSDIGMPDVDGYTLMRKVRSLPPEHGGKIPAIALTAYAGELDYQLAIASGFQHHIAKPLHPDELIKAIADLTRSPL